MGAPDQRQKMNAPATKAAAMNIHSRGWIVLMKSIFCS
jgi:hypothetical protein